MKTEDIKQIAVIGSGIMGHGIAQILICSGYKVIMKDLTEHVLNKAVDQIKNRMEKLVSTNKINKKEYQDSLSRLITTIDTGNAISDAQIIIEAVPEVFELKQKVLREISEQASVDSIIATNTSTMKISELAKELNHPENFAGMHFFNPVPKMKLTEIIQGDSTSQETFNTLFELSQKLNKIPVKVFKDSPGFIVNRSNAPGQALLNAILEEGIIEPYEIDAGMKKLGMPMGPFELADFIGLDVFVHTLTYYSETLSLDYKPGSVLLRKIERNELGKKTGHGIYDWSDGKARINTGVQTCEIRPLTFMALQVNEAVRILKEGIAHSRQDIDDAVKYGMNAFAGPFALASGIDYNELTTELDKISERFKLKIFKPEPEIKDGSFRGM